MSLSRPDGEQMAGYGGTPSAPSRRQGKRGGKSPVKSRYVFFCCQCADGPQLYPTNPCCSSCQHRTCQCCQLELLLPKSKKARLPPSPPAQPYSQEHIDIPNPAPCNPNVIGTVAPILLSIRDLTPGEARQNSLVHGIAKLDSEARSCREPSFPPSPSQAGEPTKNSKDRLWSPKFEENGSSSRYNVAYPTSYKSFACPLAKEDPYLYGDCFEHTLKREGDVKQHLFRAHLCKCKNCKPQNCKDKDHKNCQRKKYSERRWLSDTEYAALKNLTRKDGVGTWSSAWKILFPRSDFPETPYVERRSDSALLDFVEYVRNVGLDCLLLAVASRGLQVPSELHKALNEGIRDLWPRWTLRSGGSEGPRPRRVGSAEENRIKSCRPVESHATCVLFGTTFDTRTTAEQENGIFNVGECDDELQWAFDGSGLSQDVVSTNYPYLDDARQLGHGEISHDLANDLKVDAGFERGNTGLQSQAASIPRREMG